MNIDRQTVQAALDALMKLPNVNSVEEYGTNFEIVESFLRDALAQPEQAEPIAYISEFAGRQLLGHFNTSAVTLTKHRAFEDDIALYATPQQPEPTKYEFAARGTLASLKCWHRLSSEEADDLVRFFAAKELTCTWTQDADGYYSTQCGEAYVFNDGTPAQNNAYYCHHCGGKLIEAKAEDEI